LRNVHDKTVNDKHISSGIFKRRSKLNVTYM